MKKSILFFLLFLFIGILPGCSGSDTTSGPVSPIKTIPVGKGPDALFLTPNEKYLYVANVEDSIITVINTEKDEVETTISGIPYPWGFAQLNENTVAVSGWGNALVIIDVATHRIVQKKDFPDHLGGIVATKDGKYMYVIATDRQRVLKINASTLKIEDEYTTGEGPDGVGISFDDSRLYVTNTKEGTISIINVQTHESQKLSVGGKPELIHATPDRSILFISNFVANKVHILDTHTDNIIREITNLNGPEEAVISLTENRLYIVNFNINVVQVFDGKTYQKLPWEFITGKKPIGIMPVLSKKKLYVSNYGENSVYVYRSP